MDGGPPRTASRDLLERSGELERIDLLLSAASAGEGRVVLVEGPAGIGKTALLGAARERARQRGITVLGARGGELERNFPFGVVRQLFEPAFHGATEKGRAAILSGAARLAKPLLEGVDDVHANASDEGFGQLHGLYWLTVNLSACAPVLIVLDDLQWADARSLRFLLYLVGRLDGLAVVVLGAVRPGEPALDPELAVRLVGESRLEVIRPASLSEGAVAELVAQRLGQPPASAFVDACVIATGGVPFLVHELLTALSADGIEPTTERAPGVRELGPRAVARATLVRLARLPDGCLPLARATAVLGGDAKLPRCAKLAGLAEPDALVALDALVASGVVQANGRLEFLHPILRAAIYDDLAPGERSSLHRQAADLLRAEGAELDKVAAQLMPSEPTGSQEVITQLRQAAAHALARGAPEDCIAYLSRAMSEGCERELRATISLELGMAARLAGQPEMVEYFEEARRLAEDPVVRGTAALELATAVGLTGEWSIPPLELVQEALAGLGDLDTELTARLECFRAAITASHPLLVAYFDSRLPALQAQAGRDCAATRPLALLLAAVSAWRGEDTKASVALVKRGWDGGRVLAAETDLWALGRGLEALVIADELEPAREFTDALLADARERGSLARFALGSAYRGWIEARAGRLRVAGELLHAGLEPVREHHARYALGSYAWFAADVILERPESVDLVTLVNSADLGPMADSFSGGLLLDVRGRVRHSTGNKSAGIDDLRCAGEIFQALGLCNPNGSSWRSALASMLVSESHGEAVRLATSELEDARGAGQARGVGVALRTLGVLEAGERGRAHLEQAVSILERSPARLEHARTLVELGARMRRGGERTACREPLRRGLDLAVEGGAIRLAARAREELQSSGAHPRRERITGRDALTPSELRVARLAAAGSTNNEIAQALFVTPKTVDTHLSHVYRKLDISSRRVLADALEADAVAHA